MSRAAAPEVTITSPAAGSTVSHLVTISAQGTGAAGGVEFFLDGVSLGPAVPAPNTYYWNSTTASSGAHTLLAVASDGSGNQTPSDAEPITVTNPAFVNEVVVPGITSAVTIVFLPDGRMLVGELMERIRVVQPGANQPGPDPFLVLDSSQLFGEQGLRDIVLDPGFIDNGRYYIFYTRGSPGSQNHNQVSRFTASGNGTVAGSELVLWQDPLVAGNEHHGGALAFGNDGKLYITYGEHFIAENSQLMTTYRGKLLRINPDGSLPADNPFHDGSGGPQEAIWALGLRNPYRMSIDGLTGRMFIGDVGGNDNSTSMEEVNLGLAGANYGWPLCEGPCGTAGITDPIHSYPHLGRDACVTGGFVYRGSQFPSEYRGSYFFGDYVQNTIKRLTFDAGGNVTGVIDFWPADGAKDTGAVGDPGEADRGAGRVALLRGPGLQRQARAQPGRHPAHPVHE